MENSLEGFCLYTGAMNRHLRMGNKTELNLNDISTLLELSLIRASSSVQLFTDIYCAHLPTQTSPANNTHSNP